jgi:hypothetical protein
MAQYAERINRAKQLVQQMQQPGINNEDAVKLLNQAIQIIDELLPNAEPPEFVNVLNMHKNIMLQLRKNLIPPHMRHADAGCNEE